MSANHYLSPQQFLEPEDLKHVKAMDFKGNIGDPDPVGRMEEWQKMFGGTSEARPYAEGDSPTAASLLEGRGVPARIKVYPEIGK